MSQVTDIEAVPERASTWFWGLLALMVGFQVVRLSSVDPANWLALDYLMRACTLFLIGAGPMRSMMMIRVRPVVPRTWFTIWCAALAFGCVTLVWIAVLTENMLQETRLGSMPRLPPMLLVVDLTFGIALVAVHEELFFRRFARIAFRRLGDGVLMLAATTAIFGLFHWWTGVPNILVASAFGAMLMVFYQRTRVLWPAMIAHYLVNFWFLV